MKTLQQFREDAGAAAPVGGPPTNNVGDGYLAGTVGEPPMPKRKRFAGYEVFEVDNDTFHKCRLGKLRYHRYSRYVGEDETGEQIRQYGRTNPTQPVVIQDARTGAMLFLRYKRVHNFHHKH